MTDSAFRTSRMLRTSVVVAVLLLSGTRTIAAFKQGEEDEYLAAFDTLTSNSYSTPLPDTLRNACAEHGAGGYTGDEVVVSTEFCELPGCRTIKSSHVQATCGTSSLCVIASGTTVLMDSSLNLGALEIQGTLWWTDETQQDSDLHLCSGFVHVVGSGKLTVQVQSNDKRATLYVKANGAQSNWGQRFIAASDGATVVLAGREMARTWSLLSKPSSAGESTISLMHDVASMGWRVGDRLVVAPTERLSNGESETDLFVGAIHGTEITFAGAKTLSTDRQATMRHAGSFAALMSAEVINLSRNLVITGDDFTQEPCKGVSGLGSVCTVGLHTLAYGLGTSIVIQYARLERCGQRGVQGKYCLHYHLLQECPGCAFRGNAIEHGQQRAIVVHGTSLSTVEHNVISDVRGASIYLEDGNELYNKLMYNVAICPHPLSKGGCSVPGTDNSQADTDLNQAGLWSISPANHLVGNRFANSFNGMFYETGAKAGNCDGDASALDCCTQGAVLGRMEGNTFHGHGRFGSYFLGNFFPKDTTLSLANHGGVGGSNECAAFNGEGEETGFSQVVRAHVDYGNAFVGTYTMGDVQFDQHVAYDNNNGMYWKSTKNFANGCASHIQDGLYSDSGMALPDGSTFIINAQFEGAISLESNHHCNVGVTGFHCFPTYILDECDFGQWTGGWSGQPEIVFQEQANNFGGIFALSPSTTATGTNDGDGLFPSGFVVLVSHVNEHLLPIDGGTSCLRTSGIPGFKRRVGDLGGSGDLGGILCKRTLRAVKLWTVGLAAGAAPLSVSIVQNGAAVSSFSVPFFMIGLNGGSWPEGFQRQGFAFATPVGVDVELQVSWSGENVPATWSIEFSDPVIGNRFGAADEIALRVQGRDCPDVTTSDHDRRFILGDDTTFLTETGRGACTAHPDMPRVNCNAAPPLELSGDAGGAQCSNDGKVRCAGKHCANGFCECGTGQCVCLPGFVGEDCEIDLGAAARCGTHGVPAAQYLGGTLPVAAAACVCEGGFSGPLCNRDACEEHTCGGNGVCVAAGDDWRCVCEPSFSGRECETNCIESGKCNAPLACATGDTSQAMYCQGGGCRYEDIEVPVGDPWCCYKNCHRCDVVTCPPAASDCYIGGTCQMDGTCSASVLLPDGTACNSQVFGICTSGVCVAGEVTVSPTGPPTNPGDTRSPTPSPSPVPFVSPRVTPTESPTESPTDLPNPNVPSSSPTATPTTSPTIPTSGDVCSSGGADNFQCGPSQRACVNTAGMNLGCYVDEVGCSLCEKKGDTTCCPLSTNVPLSPTAIPTAFLPPISLATCTAMPTPTPTSKPTSRPHAPAAGFPSTCDDPCEYQNSGDSACRERTLWVQANDSAFANLNDAVTRVNSECAGQCTCAGADFYITTATLAPSVSRVLNELVFEDDFNGNQLDASKWDIEVNCWGGGNDEDQCYTARPDNIYVEGGALHLRAIREDYTGTPLPPQGDCTLNNENSCERTQPYTSGRVRTLNSDFGSWKYGRFEIRARLPKGRGLWPAIWMLPTDNVFGGWAASGEIDIMEARGQDFDRVEGTLHYSAAWPNNRYGGSGMRTFAEISDFSTDFHTFGLQWEENFMTWSVDGDDFYTSILDRNWCESPGCPYQNNGEPWNQQFYMLLNLAVGGNYLDGPSADDHISWQHQELVIDSVKVFSVSSTPATLLPTTSSPTASSNEGLSCTRPCSIGSPRHGCDDSVPFVCESFTDESGVNCCAALESYWIRPHSLCASCCNDSLDPSPSTFPTAGPTTSPTRSPSDSPAPIIIMTRITLTGMSLEDVTSDTLANLKTIASKLAGVGEEFVTVRISEVNSGRRRQSGLAVEIDITYPGGGKAENIVGDLEAEDFEDEINALGGSTSPGFQNFLGVETTVPPQIITLSPTPAPAPTVGRNSKGDEDMLPTVTVVAIGAGLGVLLLAASGGGVMVLRRRRARGCKQKRAISVFEWNNPMRPKSVSSFTVEMPAVDKIQHNMV